MKARQVKIEIYNAMQEGKEQEAKDLLYKYWFYFSRTPAINRHIKALLNKICTEIELHNLKEKTK